MKQILQDISNGDTLLVEAPAPVSVDKACLIRSCTSLVSTGTERMLVDFGRANLAQKALQQPHRVREVLDKVATDGLGPTVEAVRSRLDVPSPLGYSNVGVIVDAGNTSFTEGDRVVSNGPHAELVSVGQNLCAHIPDEVDDESAAFTVLGAIALQGIRLAQPTLGETVVVTGLGVVGLLTVQLLRAQGCRVLGIDLDASRCELARSFGAQTVDLSQGEDPLAAAQAISRGRGVDAVLITAVSKSNEPVHQAALMCRQRGRIVAVAGKRADARIEWARQAGRMGKETDRLAARQEIVDGGGRDVARPADEEGSHFVVPPWRRVRSSIARCPCRVNHRETGVLG